MSEPSDAGRPEATQQELSPSPQSARASSTESSDAHGTHSRREQILGKLELMPGLVAAGILNSQKANSMRAIYQTMLSNRGESQLSSGASVPDGDVLLILKERPELLAPIKPFLTPQQLDMIVHHAAAD